MLSTVKLRFPTNEFLYKQQSAQSLTWKHTITMSSVVRYPQFPVLQDINLYPYSPITKDDDIETMRSLPLGYRKKFNPLLPLKSKPVKLKGKEVIVRLLFEAREPSGAFPRLFEASIIKKPSKSGLPRKGKKVIIEAFDRRSFHSNPLIRSQNIFLHTVASYEKLKPLQGKSIPKFYGSFVMEVPVVNRHERGTIEILAVIREHVDGIFMSEMKPDLYTTDERKEIMRRVINAEKEVNELGVSLASSIIPHSFILVGDKGGEFKAVVWNFSFTSLGICTDSHPITFPGAISSALLKWKSDRFKPSGFKKLVDWKWVPWLYEEYGHELENLTDEEIRVGEGLDKKIEQLRNGEIGVEELYEEPPPKKSLQDPEIYKIISRLLPSKENNDNATETQVFHEGNY